MLRHHHKTIKHLITVCMLLVMSIAFAKSESDAAEAKSVSVTWTDTGHEGVVSVNDCVQCPLSLTVSEKTKFKHKGKKIKALDTYSLSGKPGTVIYDKEKNLALKVNW